MVFSLQRIADVPINFADPMVRRAPVLQQTADSVKPSARLSEVTLAELGLTCGTPVRVKQFDGEAVLVAKADNTVPAGCVRVSAAHATTAMLGDMFGMITVERA
jgi:NADH-quinone oxidoreductase subunit G